MQLEITKMPSELPERALPEMSTLLLALRRIPTESVVVLEGCVTELRTIAPKAPLPILIPVRTEGAPTPPEIRLPVIFAETSPTTEMPSCCASTILFSAIRTGFVAGCVPS